MCLIAYADASILLANIALLDEALSENPHGSGMVSRSGKTVLNNKLGLKFYLKMSKGLTAIHFRWATKGHKAAHNIHPFELDDSYLFHNGTVTMNDVLDLCENKGDRDFFRRLWLSSNKSDTNILAMVLNKLSKDERDHALHSLAAGGSKFLLSDKETGEIQEYGQFYDLDGMRVSNFYSFPSLNPAAAYDYPYYGYAKYYTDEVWNDSEYIPGPADYGRYNYKPYAPAKQTAKIDPQVCLTPGCESEDFDMFGRCYFCWEYSTVY